MWRFFKRRQITLKKKTAHAAELQRHRLKVARQAWFEGQLDLDPTKLVFIDETGATTKMARRHGRAPRGERCRAGIPHGHWKTTTLTAGLRLSGITAPMVIDGPTDGAAFLAYLKQILAPKLAPGEVVIMDNLPAHRVAGVCETIEARGAGVIYLPPYSPDFNPIELAFAKLKALLRAAAARTIPDLWAAIAEARVGRCRGRKTRRQSRRKHISSCLPSMLVCRSCLGQGRLTSIFAHCIITGKARSLACRQQMICLG